MRRSGCFVQFRWTVEISCNGLRWCLLCQCSVEIVETTTQRSRFGRFMFQEGKPAVKVAVAPILKSPCAIAGCAGVLVPGFCGYSFLVLAVEGLIGFGLGVLEVKGLPLNFCSLKNTCWNTNIMVLLRLACQVSPECFCFILKALTACMFEIPFISKIITDTSI